MHAPLMAAITGLPARFDRVDDRGQERLRVERAAGEFLDVRAARKRAVVADDHDRAHLRIGQRTIERRDDARCATRATAH